jgi:formamidopyrimidine-DNA glycosylase
MPELPDVVVYVERLQERILGETLTTVRLQSLFLLRTVDPPLRAVEGRIVSEVSRLGKRILIGLENDLVLALHLMVAGRLHWREPAARIPGRVGLAAFDFPRGTLVLTEAGSKRRAALHLVRRAELGGLDRGGLEVLSAGPAEFVDALTRENHTLKRALTDPRILSGIGNAYSDEILHRARLSPLKQTSRLSVQEIARLREAARETLVEWIERLRRDSADGFPEGVTAFRKEMAVHGRYGRPCRVCGAPVQRIVYAENETNYCARCQTGGRLLADRSLSRLLRADWPKSVDDLE